jgi:hypothetical protein
MRCELLLRTCLLFCFACASSIASAQELAQQLREGILIDPAYRLRIEPRGAGWAAVPEADARKMVPDAVAGITKAPQVYGVIIVEPAADGSLENWARAIVGRMPLEDRREEAFELTEFQGRPAVRIQTSGRTRGLAVRFQHLVFQNEGYLYQIVAWGLHLYVKSDGRALQPVVASVRLLDGPVKRREEARPTSRAHGIGWRINDGILTDAAHGLRIKPPASWRLVVGDELTQMNADASVGLVAAEEEAYFVLISERAAGVDPKRLEDALREAIAAENEALPEPVIASIAGSEVRLDRYALSAMQGITLLHGVLIRNGVAHQIQAWFLDRLKEKAMASLPSAFAAVGFLEGDEWSKERAEIAALPDFSNVVGPRYSFRQGVYRDFGEAFSWRRPMGFWKISTGDAARAENGDCCLFVEEIASGLNALVIAEELHEASSAEFHATVLGNFEDSGTILKQGETVPTKIGEIDARRTELILEVETHTFAYQVTTAVTPHRTYQFLLWGFPGNLENARELAAETLRGFEIHPGGLREIVTSDASYADSRMGFELLAPTAEASFEEILPKAVQSLGTAIRCRYDDGFSVLLAVAALQDTQDAAWFEQFAMTHMLTKFREGFRGDPESFEDRIGDLPCRARRWRSDGKQSVLFNFTRDRTHFAYLVTGRDENEITAAKERLRLLR